MYGPTAYLTKLSILWIMTRVFNPYRKAVIFIYVFLGTMLAYYIPAVIVKIRICKPITTFWDPSGTKGGSCLDQTAIILADAVVSVVSDLIVLILPLPLTLSLQMSWQRKMRVMGILCAGGLAVASSIVRLVLIVVIGQSKDATMSFTRISMFGLVIHSFHPSFRKKKSKNTIIEAGLILRVPSNAEIAIGVVCACLPALSALVTNVYRETSSKKTTNYDSEYGLQNTKNWSRKSRADRSKNGASMGMTKDEGSDEDILMSHAQGNPKIETSIHGEDTGDRRQGEDPLGILKTVNVSTSVTTMK